jgi:hypothetical protein
MRFGVREREKRHLIFATRKQLRLLKRIKRWYLDGTFRLVKKNHGAALDNPWLPQSLECQEKALRVKAILLAIRSHEQTDRGGL